MKLDRRNKHNNYCQCCLQEKLDYDDKEICCECKERLEQLEDKWRSVPCVNMSNEEVAEMDKLRKEYDDTRTIYLNR